MRLTRSESVGKRRKDQKLRNKFKGKKKHKRLDAICEKAYTRSHKGVEKVESAEIDNGGNELELRRSSRTRRAPVLLDSSPMPPKKRRKIDKSVTCSVEKVRRKDGVQCETPCSSSRDLDGNVGWVSRLRSRAKSAGFSGRRKGESSLKGKRKLFEDSDGSGDEMEPESCDKKEILVGEKSTVVRSKRPGRIKASNGLANENQEKDLGGRVEDGKEKNTNKLLEEISEVDGLCLEVKLDCRGEIGVKDCHVASEVAEREETEVQRDSDFEGCQSNGNVEGRNESVELEKLACDLVPDQENVVKVDCAAADQENVVKVDCATADQANDEAHPDKSLEDETCKKSKGKYNTSFDADSKPRIKLGRRCGLCGGGTDGKPPKILVLEGAGSDNEAYSGSSASDEPNYDVWDGFGDQSGWLGRLLGPINDRFGIAGIWVHQQCAVWSPEVYFAGLGCLKNVRAALYRGRVLKCSRCRRPGATIGCRVDRCPKTYHLPCARAKGCIFDHRKFLIACTDHRRLFQPHGIQNAQRLKKMKAKKLKLELRKMANDACRKDIEAEEKWRIAYFARKGADCLGKYVGDAERQLRLLFQVAEKSQPSIIFFDEIDGLAPCRSKQQDQTHNSVVSTLLALMDGLKSRGSVIVIGATNRPDAVDPALRRPGRFDREIYFPLPSVKDREGILSLHTQKWPKPISGSLLKWVAKHTVGFAGADLQALCTQAAIIALRSFPLQEVLSAAETRAANNKCPAIPTFAVEERLPLTRLLVCLYLDERIWLPSHLNRASILVKNVIVSALDSRRVQNDKWWLHIDGLLQEVDVTSEIERNLLLANVLVEESNPCGSIVIEDYPDEDCSKNVHHKSQYMGARPGLLQKLSTGS
ncbi:UNVERIFIED_CONTAM: Tat-binding7 [Sesamum calycinum]|uniref:Tat-binding7 n=1 Tax=Sesamum calycinum TaxID=2727403 RepID=A0AAW2ME97_9LAMI